MKTHCPNCDCEINFPEIVDESISCPSCGSRIMVADDETQTLTVELQHQRLGDRFDLVSKSGKGQFGEVYKAKDLLLDRYVAIKVPFRKSLTYSQLSMIQYEAQAAAQLEHPNIVRIYEILRASNPVTGPAGDSTAIRKSKSDKTVAGTETDIDSGRKIEAEPGSLCIISQWIDGLSLKECIAKYKGNYDAIARFVATVAKAIDFAHQNGIIHRDLKPANIMVDAQDNPYVTDFGLARRDRRPTESDDGSTTVMVVGIRGEILGTPAYMSPQQAKGLSHQVDGRTDVYSLGIILYEMLTGKRPFEGGSRALLYRVIHEDIPDPRKIDKQIPRDLVSICQKAAEKEPSARYASAAEMAADLDRFLKREPILADPWPWQRRAWRWVRLNRAPIAIAASILLLFGIIVQASIPNRPDWERTALMVSIDTEDHSPDAEFFFEKLNPETYLPDPVEPFTLGPFKHPVKTKIPAGFYRVYAWTPDNRYHQVLRTVPQLPDEGKQYGKIHWYDWKDGVAQLPAVRLFSGQERPTNLVNIKGNEFKTGLYPNYPEKTYQVPDLYVGETEVTWHDIRRANIQLPPGMSDAPTAKDEDPVVGVQHSWVAELAENLGGEACNELVWLYCDSVASSLPRGLSGFRSDPDEATVDLGSSSIILGYKDGKFSRRVNAIGVPTKDVGFRLYIRAQAPRDIESLMRQKD
jgi:serine/threonine-protein kinase